MVYQTDINFDKVLKHYCKLIGKEYTPIIIDYGNVYLHNHKSKSKQNQLQNRKDRKNLVIFYLIDSSGSMSGSKIGIVNNTMDEVIPEIRNIGGSDSDIKIAVLQFDSNLKWMDSEPQSVETFTWKSLNAYGLTRMGDAFKELNQKMSRNAFLKSPGLSFAPVIILLSDGEPTDDYEKGLEELKNNKWFKYSLKVAIAIGSDANKDILEEFTDNSELVLESANGKQLADMLKFVSIASIQVSSQGKCLKNNGSTTIFAPIDKKNESVLVKTLSKQFKI